MAILPGLGTQSFIWESMWPTRQTNNVVTNFRGWRCSLPSGTSLALPHPNSWLETCFAFPTKLIAYAVFQLKSLYWFVYNETVDSIYNNLGGLIER